MPKAIIENEDGSTAVMVDDPDDVTTAVVETPPEPKPERRIEKTFTKDELEKARREEKEKLYPEITELREQLKTLNKKMADDDTAKQAEIARLAKEKEEKEKEGLSALELLEKERIEFQKERESLRADQERALALIEHERRFNQLRDFREIRVREEADAILPDLTDLIQGNSEEEIEASIAYFKQKTDSIVNGVTTAQRVAQMQQKGTSVTSPTVGPADNQPGTRTFTVDDIKNMSMQEYAKWRDQLITGRPIASR